MPRSSTTCVLLLLLYMHRLVHAHVTFNMYKVYMYPGEETFLPWVEFCKDKDEAIEVGNRWVTSEEDYHAEEQED